MHNPLSSISSLHVQTHAIGARPPVRGWRDHTTVETRDVLGLEPLSDWSRDDLPTMFPAHTRQNAEPATEVYSVVGSPRPTGWWRRGAGAAGGSVGLASCPSRFRTASGLLAGTGSGSLGPRSGRTRGSKAWYSLWASLERAPLGFSAATRTSASLFDSHTCSLHAGRLRFENRLGASNSYPSVHTHRLHLPNEPAQPFVL